jgi:hypothetical protein
MSDLEHRPICPKCGSTEYKKMGRLRSTAIGILTAITMAGFLMIIAIFIPILWFIALLPFLYIPFTIIVPPKRLICRNCGNMWQYHGDAVLV